MRVHRSTFAALVIFLWSVTSAWAQSAHTWQFSGADIFLDSGSVSIGTSTFHSDNKLAVKGKALVRELDLKISDQWPDYVFEEGYELLPLNDLKQAVRERGHLPGMPSAEEVENSGIKIGQMNGLLLQKIEELTLYIISQDRVLEKIRQRIVELERQGELTNPVIHPSQNEP